MKIKETLNLPKTAFPMKLDKATEARLMESVADSIPCYPLDNEDWKQKFVLHDGPPFANGDIHLGHAVNKVVKDITNRLAKRSGKYGYFRPGWDCHGLPIEMLVKEAKGHISDPAVFRDLCAAHAKEWMEAQKESFRRLGIMGQWGVPYVTMNPDYEGDVLRVFAKVVGNGLVFRKKKPVHWSIENQTALAVGELEYKEVTDKSIYVGFRQYTSWNSHKDTQFLVWTTTPWTLPANVCLAVNENADYVRVLYRTRTYILAEARAAELCPDHQVLERINGKQLTGFLYIPLRDARGYADGATFCKIYHADFVSTETGTGIVHIAPDHGMDDYLVGEANELYSRTPVLKDGTYEKNVEPSFLAGRNIFEAQIDLIADLALKNQIHSIAPVTHEYPHDWRSKKRTIQLATEQWFIGMDIPYAVDEGDEPKTLRQRAIEACESVEFIPAHGKTRLLSMLKTRPDWCISRQRYWGLPIPAFYDGHGDAMLTRNSVELLSQVFRHYGSNAWYKRPSNELIDDPFDRPLMKETDTFDVWFESAASWASMNVYLGVADVYLEGSDQHRGWFQHSLLLSLAARGFAPFKKVVTHGFVVKPDGTKVSKSDPEYVRANETMDELGIDPIRLWIASNDFQQDICASPEMLKEFLPKYNKVRNTLRYLLSNLYDFEPKISFKNPHDQSLDMWIMWRLKDLEKNYQDAADVFAYHTAVAHIFNFLNTDLSAVYANARKDRLYCGGKASLERRQAQSAMYVVLVNLCDMLEPIIPYTVAEIREHFPHTDLPHLNIQGDFDAWTIMFSLRADALTKLDVLKREKGVTKATDAEIVYRLDARQSTMLKPYGADLEDIVGCGCHSITINHTIGLTDVDVFDRRNDYKACQRSWKRRPDVEEAAGGFVLSKRDRDVLTDIAKASEATDPITFEA